MSLLKEQGLIKPTALGKGIVATYGGTYRIFNDNSVRVVINGQTIDFFTSKKPNCHIHKDGSRFYYDDHKDIIETLLGIKPLN